MPHIPTHTEEIKAPTVPVQPGITPGIAGFSAPLITTTPEQGFGFTAPTIPNQITATDLATTPVPVVTPPPQVPIPPAPVVPAQPVAPPPTDFEKSLAGLETKVSEFEGLPRQKETAVAVKTQPFEQQLNEINQQIREHQLASMKAQEQALKSGETLGFARGEATEVERQNAFEAFRLSSLAQAMQGNILTATKQAETAINLKYAQTEADIRAARNNIIQNYDQLTSAQKKRADATLQRLDSQDAFVKEQKAKAAEVQKAVLDYVGVADNLTLDAMSKAGSALEVAQIAQRKGIKSLAQQKEEKALVPSDIQTFKAFFPNVDVATEKGRQTFLAWQKQQATAKATGTPGTYVPGTNPTVDNWARLIIAGQATITNVPNPRGSTLRSDVANAIATSGQLLLSDKDREKLSTLDTAFNVANTIKELSEKINTFGVGGRVTGYLSRYVGGATQYNTDIARYKAAREGFVSNVARTLGEKGTLAEGDVRRAIANLPTVNDTKAVAEGKLKTLFSILEGTRNSIIQKSTEPLTSVTSGTLSGITIQGGGGITTPETLRAKYNY